MTISYYLTQEPKYEPVQENPCLAMGYVRKGLSELNKMLRMDPEHLRELYQASERYRERQEKNQDQL